MVDYNSETSSVKVPTGGDTTNAILALCNCGHAIIGLYFYEC